MKVAVIGPGSLGTLFGGLLANDGHEVWLCHYRESYAEAIRRDGVRIESDILDESVVEADIEATTDASEAGHVDLALVLVKAHQTRDALDRHEGCIGPGTAVLSLQNGLLNERILSDIVGAEQVLTGITYQGGDRGEPGRVEHTYTGETRFGGEDMDAAREIATALTEAGIENVAAIEDYRRRIWEKQIGGVSVKPLAALTRLTCGGMVADEDRVELMRALMREAEAVAEAHGIGVDVDYDADVIDPLVDSPHRSSILQDVTAERKTEIDHINGAIVELAAEVDVDVPRNEAVTTLVRGLEDSYLGED